MQHAAKPRILFIDAYDSFSNNIISQLETRLHVDVTVVRIDTTVKDLPEFLKSFHAVVAGPGPGDPRKPQDVGIFRKIWQLRDDDLLPILGICLGFQSLVLAFGGTIERLQSPRHGVVRRVRSNGKYIFRGIDCLETVQYHSLFGKLDKCMPSDDKKAAFEQKDLWKTSPDCPDLIPLAWECQADNHGSTDAVQPDENPPHILMAVKHREKPFYGTQFHAESICSSVAAQNVLANWWHEALEWRQRHRKATKSSQEESDLTLCREKYSNPSCKTGRSARSGTQFTDDISLSYGCQNGLSDRQGQAISCSSSNVSQGTGKLLPTRGQAQTPKLEVVCKVSDLGDLTVPTICEAMSLTKGEAIVFDSENHKISEVGEFSIIGVVAPSAVRFDYHIGDSEVRQVCGGTTSLIDLRRYENDIFSFLKTVMRQYQAESPHTRIPFWGGLMGFISYEACLETIQAPLHRAADQTSEPNKPDLSFVFIERSVVIDHVEKKIHIQSIKPGDRSWVNKTASLIYTPNMKPIPHSLPSPLNAQISYPSGPEYKSKVRACRSSVAAGDSYELCLTTRATIHTPTSLPPWPIYLRLRSLNPAPFAAYLRLGKLTLLSSSPERFLRWTRPTRRKGNPKDLDQSVHTTSKCQFRPIKGTLLRQPSPKAPPLTLPEATALLSTPKERAENLMIVDLIRHDLHGVVGSGRVTVPKLMAVEEYATLFQLVTVIEGTLFISHNNSDGAVEDADTAPGIPNDDLALTLPQPSSAHPRLPSPPHPRSPPPPPPPAHQPPLTPTHIPPPVQPPPSTHPPTSPIDILARSLPPGSMTGAPKLRSTQLLSSLEQQPRGVYSGVVGYFDVGGGGDFSVVIRSAVRWDGGDDDEEEGKGSGGDVWTVGAGGAVTWLSTEEGEWAEMEGKLRSTLRIFED